MSSDIDRNLAPEADRDDSERILSMRIGGTTVREALEAAIASGHVLRDAQGRLRLADSGRLSAYVNNLGGFAPECKFLIQFMYAHVYRKKAVPAGCSACFKIKVISSTLRQLMAVKVIAETLPYSSKSGPEVENRRTQALYGTYFYFSSLKAAREAYKQIRPKIDSDSALGAAVKMIIKRGCTEYERAHGPLDNYSFDSRQREIETYLRGRFDGGQGESVADKQAAETMKLLYMVQIAYQIGDETYKDFTGGRDLNPPVVTYDPDGPEAGEHLGSER